jgi:hypothetical protein
MPGTTFEQALTCYTIKTFNNKNFREVQVYPLKEKHPFYFF